MRWESGREVLHTSSYHFRAFAGRLYCFAFSLRSSTKEGKTASNFFFASLDDMAVEKGCQVAIRVVKEVGELARDAGAFAGRIGRNLPANGRKFEALKTQAPYKFRALPDWENALRNRSELGMAALDVEGMLKAFFCSARRLCKTWMVERMLVEY